MTFRIFLCLIRTQERGVGDLLPFFIDSLPCHAMRSDTARRTGPLRFLCHHIHMYMLPQRRWGAALR